jgi:hypothetical protein
LNANIFIDCSLSLAIILVMSSEVGPSLTLAKSTTAHCAKIALILTTFLAFAGCATNQTIDPSQPDPRVADKSEHPELAGLSQDQIRRLMWRVQ